MRQLDRYMLRELAIPLAFCLVGFLVFWLSADLFEQLASLLEKKYSTADIIAYYVGRLPELLSLIMPIALLLAMLYALTNHSRYNEIVAMRNAGLSIWRITAPYLLVGLVASAVVFWLNEQIPPSRTEWRQQAHFQNVKQHRYWTIGSFNTRTGEMIQPQVDWREPDGVRRRLFAARGEFRDGVWTFHEVQMLEYPLGESFDARGMRTNTFVSTFRETPREIETFLKFANLTAVAAAKRAHLSIAELTYLRGALQLNARDRTVLDTQFHARLASPWTCLVVVLVSIPIAASSNRRNAFVGVASSIGICFTFFILMRLGLALSASGVIPPWVGAWAPNAIFASVGLALTFAAR